MRGTAHVQNNSSCLDDQDYESALAEGVLVDKGRGKTREDGEKKPLSPISDNVLWHATRQRTGPNVHTRLSGTAETCVASEW